MFENRITNHQSAYHVTKNTTQTYCIEENSQTTLAKDESE